MRVLVCLLPLLVAGCAKISPFRQPDVPESYDEVVTRRESNGLLGDVVGNASIKQQVRSVVGRGVDKDQARELYNKAEQLYREASIAKDGERKRKFLKAGENYAGAALRWPDSSLEEDALFMEADSLFFADHYFDANAAFEKLLKKYPNSKHLDRAEARRFSIARFWEQAVEKEPEPFYFMNFFKEERPFRDSKGGAMRIYDKIRIDDPTGRLSDDATMAAANLHFENGKYVLADEYYTDLRRTFPNSEHLFMAHFLGLRAKMASYQGTDYSGTVLRQSENLIKTIRTQFPHKYREQQQYIDRAAAEIKFQLAEREWANAQYYDRRDEFGAARFHYARLMEEYPGTPFAQKASERVQNIHGLPAVPPQKAEWLVNLFPNEAAPKLKALPVYDQPGLVQQGEEAIARAPQGPPLGSR